MKTWICPQYSNQRPRVKIQAGLRTFNSWKTINALYCNHYVYTKTISWETNTEDCCIWNNISCFWFWWITDTKCCVNNYVTSRVYVMPNFPRLHFVADHGVIILNYMVVKIPILILFRFCLISLLFPVLIVAASCFNYLGPFRWL